MKTFIKKFTDREAVDFFAVQLFSVFTLTFFVTLLILNIQQQSAVNRLQSNVDIADNASSLEPVEQRIHAIPVSTISKQVNIKKDHVKDKARQISKYSLADKSANNAVSKLTSDHVELEEKTRVPKQIKNNTEQVSNNPSQYANVIVFNASSFFSNGSSNSAGASVSSSSSNQNLAPDRVNSSSSVSQQNISQPTIAANLTALNSQQNSNSNAVDDDGDGSLEILGAGTGTASSGVTNGTRLDGSVRRECPPLERFLERDRDRVASIQRSLGCII